MNMKKIFTIVTIALAALFATGMTSCEEAGSKPSVDPDTISFPAEGGTRMITVTSDSDWTATPGENWISGRVSGNTFEVTVGAATDERSGTVTVSNASGSTVVTVTQEAPEEPPVVPTEVTFTSVTEAVYHGKAGSNDELGRYSITLETAEHTLYIEFLSSFTDEIIPVPDEGEYELAADDEVMTFKNSTWRAENNGVETNRKLSSGTFTWEASDNGFKIAGLVAGRDEAELKFEYDGPVEFLNRGGGGEPAENAIVCQGATGTYYGKYYIPSAASFYLVIWDTPHLAEGDPWNLGIRLDFTSAFPAGSMMPEMGTYRVDSKGTFDKGTFVPGMMDGSNGSFRQVKDGSGSSRFPIIDGFFTIRKNDDGRYQVFGTLIETGGQEISFNYVGALTFNNDAVGKLTTLTTDFAMGNAFYANQRCYSIDTEANLNYWKLYFYNEAAWTTQGQDGYFLGFDIALPPDAQSIPAGRYVVGEHVMIPKTSGEFIAGYLFADIGAYGSWLATGAGKPVSPISGGELNLVKNSDGTFTATFDVLDDDFIPKHITGTFSGEIPLSANSLIQ